MTERGAKKTDYLIKYVSETLDQMSGSRKASGSECHYTYEYAQVEDILKAGGGKSKASLST